MSEGKGELLYLALEESGAFGFGQSQLDLRRAYDLLAEDPSGADIESAFAIQAEALLGE
jgi:hypothetical protein